MQVEPYLFFHGRCEEALDFYRSALGAVATGRRARNRAVLDNIYCHERSSQRVQ